MSAEPSNTAYANPLGPDDAEQEGGTPEKTDEVVGETVVSPVAKDFMLCRMGMLYSVSGGALTFAISTLVGVGVFVMFVLLSSDVVGEKSALGNVFFALTGTAASVLLIGAHACARHALAKDSDGTNRLDRLGAGSVMISQQAFRKLNLFNIMYAWPIFVSWSLLGLICLASATKVGGNSVLTGKIITEEYALACVFAALTFWGDVLTFFPWQLTMQQAAALVASAVAEVKETIEHIDPTSSEWETVVTPMVLKLCGTTVPMLSHGWGDAIGFFAVGMWTFSAGMFAGFLDAHSVRHTDNPNAPAMLGFMAVVGALAPLLMAFDAAAASSDCGSLANVLTAKRMAADPRDMEYEHAIDRIEKILDRQNTKQGLGFVVFGRVIDMKTLGTILAALVSVGSTLVPILFTLVPAQVKVGDNVCDLSTTQISTIQSTMLSRNTSCAFNMSLAEILAM